MTPINEVYPECAEAEKRTGGFYGPCDYSRMIDSMGFENLLQVDDDDYQGDSRLILRDGLRYGVLIFGWGSCSGCDALQDCDTMAEIESLRSDLFDSIKWFSSKAECLHYMTTHDWEGDYCWHKEETQQFIDKAKELLAS